MNSFELMMDLGRWLPGHMPEVVAGMVGAPLLLGAASLALRRGRQQDVTTHGSARWATPSEVKRAGLYTTHGVVLGRHAGRLLCDDSEAHVLLIAPSRSGKGLTTIIPTLFTWLGSALILDPKDGENYDVTAPWRSQVAHNQIAYFTPCRTPHACINVEDTIRFNTPYEFGDAHTISQSLTAPEKMAKETSAGIHFRELAALTLTAGQLHVGYTVQHPSLAAVWAFMTQFHDNFHACMQAMQTTRHVSGGVHQAILALTRAISSISEKELGSIWSTAIRPLVLYNDPLIARSTDTSTFDLQALQYGAQPMSLYMVAPSPRVLDRLHPLYRVVLDVAMARLMDHKVRTWQHRLLVCADELPAHGYVHAIDKGAADMAGYGMKGLFVAQDLEQLEETYGEKNNLWGNTDLNVFHTPAPLSKTAGKIAERLMGKGTVEHETQQRQGGLFGKRSTSQGHVARALLTPDEVMELPPGLEIIRKKGMKPILAEKIDYRTDPAFAHKAA